MIKEIKKDRNEKDKEVPILLRDKNGEMVYETVKGKFLNNDQFWKDLGGRNSFSKLQDRFNKYITSKGFNLDRGEIGANITLVAKYLGHSKIDETLNTYSHMYQNRLENIVQIIKVQNTKLLESNKKELPEPRETIIDYKDTEYYDYDEDLDNKKKDDLVL